MLTVFESGLRPRACRHPDPAVQQGGWGAGVAVCGSSTYSPTVTRCDTMRKVVDGLWWREQDAAYIRQRSVRYPGAIGIEPEWTVEAAADPRRIVRDPDPKSRSSAIRVIGYSPSAGFVVTVIATRSDRAGVTAWKTTGTDLREYEGQSRP